MINNEEVLLDDNEVSSEKNTLNLLDSFFSKWIYGNSLKIDVYILITKKSFWSYQIYIEKSNGKDTYQDESKMVLSDRYFEKTLDFKKYDGLSIGIIDDTMNTGTALYEFYKTILSHCPSSKGKIFPIVCLLSKTADVQLFSNDDMFIRNLKNEYMATPEQIGNMCVFETLIFHKELVPYVVDLPVLERKTNGNMSTRKLQMSIDYFNSLCRGNEYWTFHSLNYDIIPGETAYGGFFSYFNSLIKIKMNKILLNMVIKVQYVKNDDNVTVVFTPFAILRSVKMEELEQCFDCLFENTPYKKSLKKPSLVKNPESYKNYYTAIYRAVVYCLSMYIGVKFIQFMKPDCDVCLVNRKQFEDKFYASIDEIFPSQNNYQNFNERDFLLKFLDLPEFSAVGVEKQDMVIDSRVASSEYEQKDWFAFLHEKIISTKRKVDNKKYFSSEEFEEALFNKCYIEDKDTLATKLLLEALNKSILTNCLDINLKLNTVYRGYQHGENTELLFPYDARIFYKGILTYYMHINKNLYLRMLDYYFIRFEEFLRYNGLFDIMITKEEFNFFKNYFGDLPVDEIETQITNKKYLFQICKEPPFLSETLNKIEDFTINFTRTVRAENEV